MPARHVDRRLSVDEQITFGLESTRRVVRRSAVGRTFAAWLALPKSDHRTIEEFAAAGELPIRREDLRQTRAELPPTYPDAEDCEPGSIMTLEAADRLIKLNDWHETRFVSGTDSTGCR